MNANNMLQFIVLTLSLLSTAHIVSATAKIQRFQWNGVRGVVLSDGRFDLCGLPFLNVPEDEYLKSVRRLHRDSMPLRRAINVLVADVGGKRYLVDTGALSTPNLQQPFFLDAGKLMQSMRMAGIHPNSIDAILLTHGHFDHVLGLRTRRGKRAFPRAKVYISKKEHRFWSNPTNETQILPNLVGMLSPNSIRLHFYNSGRHRFYFRFHRITDPLILFVPIITQTLPTFDILGVLSNTYKASIKPYLKDLRLITDGAEPFPGVKFRQSRGHSPGHMSIELGTGKDKLVVAGDVWALSVSFPKSFSYFLNSLIHFSTFSFPSIKSILTSFSRFLRGGQAIQFKRLGAVGAIESNRNQLVRNRIKLLKRLADNGNLVLSYHETFPGLGFVEPDGSGGYDWIIAPVDEMDGPNTLQCNANQMG